LEVAGVLLSTVVTRHRAHPGAAVGVVITGFFAGAVIGPLAAGPLVGSGSYELNLVVVQRGRRPRGNRV
jgi:hypothetical protein